MRTLRTTATVLLALGLLVGAAEARSVKIQKVKGTLTATDDDSKAKGKFLLGVVEAGDLAKERLLVVAKGLDPDLTYEVYLGESVAEGTLFGELTVRGRGYGFLKIRKDDFPDGVTSLTAFSGESVFVVEDDDTVLSGDIPEFVDPGTDDEAGDGSFALGFGETQLSVPEDVDSDARARLYLAAVNTPRGAREVLTLLAAFLDEDETYGVYLVNDGSDDERLGTLRPRSRFGFASLVLDTGRGHDLPDHLGDLAGKTIEVRNGDGDVILTGEVPALD